MSRKECAEYFSVTEKIITRRLSEYGIKKDSKSRYENIKKAFIDKYGTESVFSCDLVREKAKKTMMRRYGVEYTAQSRILQEKMQKTMMRRYGIKNYVETKEFQEKSSQTCNKKQGVNWPCQYKECISALEKTSGHSKPERDFSNLLKKYNLKFEQEFPIRGFKYDFKIGNYLFEINPSGTHNVNFGVFGHKPKKRKISSYQKHCCSRKRLSLCAYLGLGRHRKNCFVIFKREKDRLCS